MEFDEAEPLQISCTAQLEISTKSAWDGLYTQSLVWLGSEADQLGVKGDLAIQDEWTYAKNRGN